MAADLVLDHLQFRIAKCRQKTVLVVLRNGDESPKPATIAAAYEYWLTPV